MSTTTTALIVFVLVVSCVYRIHGDTCICNCCAGNFCTNLQNVGNVTVTSCTSNLNCTSPCSSAYPSTCGASGGSSGNICVSSTTVATTSAGTTSAGTTSAGTTSVGTTTVRTSSAGKQQVMSVAILTATIVLVALSTNS